MIPSVIPIVIFSTIHGCGFSLRLFLLSTLFAVASCTTPQHFPSGWFPVASPCLAIDLVGESK